MPKIDTTVESLVSMIRTGELRLPEMQRRYVWPATRVRDLLDSLYRGYPSGTVLVWETDREMPSRDLAVKQESSPFKGHKLLLDGQQRLTSLSAILRGEPVTVRGKKKPIEILFNLDHPDGPPVEVVEVEGDDNSADPEDPDVVEDEEDENAPNLHERLKLRTFVVASRQLEADPHWVKVSEVFKEEVNDAQLLRRLVKTFDDPNFDKYSKRLQRVRRIRDYPYVMHVLDKELSYEEVAEIFVRVNSLGVKLRGSDLALAQITSRWPDSLKLFEQFQEECEQTWFTLELGLIVRALVVFATGQARFKTVGSTSVDRFREAWERCKDGLRYAINFLRSNAGVDDESLLSSPLLMITLAFFGAERGFVLNGDDERLLKQWLHVANARGHYGVGSSETTLDMDLGVIKRGGGPAELLDVLKKKFGRLEVHPEDLVGRSQRSPVFAVAFLALKAHGAKDWRTRLALSLTHQGKYHFIQYHHVFPKATLKDRYERALINEMANFAFITGGTNRKIGARTAVEYLSEVMVAQGEDALRAHCIPPNAALWEIDSFPRFLEERRRLLAQAINEFIFADEPLAGTVPVEDLVAAGETTHVEFKSSLRWDVRENRINKDLEKTVLKTLCAFLNGNGGTLLIGVADDGAAVGINKDLSTLGKRPDRDGYQQHLVTLISTAMGKETCGSLAISFHPFHGVEICRIDATPSTRPVYVEEGDKTRFYLRTGNLTQELLVKEAHEYLAVRWPNKGTG